MNKILIIRTDSIGDNILSTSIVPYLKNHFKGELFILCQEHIKELYEASPYVDKIITFNRNLALQNEKYRKEILKDLQKLKIDICINPVYSREPLTDFFATGTKAREIIGFYGDLCNTNYETWCYYNKFYTKLIKCDKPHLHELKKYKIFLKKIGIKIENELEPIIWITQDDLNFAGKFFKENNLLPEKTIAFWAGVQNEIRRYNYFDGALAKSIPEDFTILAFGSKNDYPINESFLKNLKHKYINLSGKLTLRQTAALISKCCLSIGAETGLALISESVKTPSIILIGGGHFGRFLPFLKSSLVCLPLKCYYCNWNCKYIKPYCVQNISPKVFASAITYFLKKPSSEKPRIFVQSSKLWKDSQNRPKWKLFEDLIDFSEVEVFEVDENLKIKRIKSFKKNIKKANIKVSAIVSTYNSEKFIKGCLEDLVSQTLYEKGELEIIVIDSASQENEWKIVRRFQKKYKNIIYIRTSERETIYAAWNKGIKLARGKYITNANTDDRHRKAALEIMAEELDKNPEIALVYGDQIITKTPNETFEKCTPVAFFKWPEFDRNILLHLPCVGPQPMWRKSLHDEFGYFNEELKVAGDYEWWLRISEKYKFKHIPELLGLYYWNDYGVEHSNKEICTLETDAIREFYLKKAKIKPINKNIPSVIYNHY